jgi:hypothetical protein
VSAVAFDTPLAFEHRLRTVPREPEGDSLAESRARGKPAADGDIKPWELHSELVLVCPEVCDRARELLPQRDPDAFLSVARDRVRPATGETEEARGTERQWAALVEYVGWRLLETARTALFVFGSVVTLALLAEALH